MKQVRKISINKSHSLKSITNVMDFVRYGAKESECAKAEIAKILCVPAYQENCILALFIITRYGKRSVYE